MNPISQRAVSCHLYTPSDFLGSPISLKLLRSVVSFIHLQIVHIISLYCCVPTISQLITLEANTSSCYNSSVHVLLVAQLGLTFLFYLIELFIMLQMLHLLGLFAYLFCRLMPTECQEFC